MSGPNAPPMNMLAGLLGGGGMPRGPKPPMPIGQSTKRLGDQRVPMSSQRPRVNPGQVQDQAARKLGVPREQVQPTERPPQPQVQAPPPPSLPQGIPMPRPDPRGQDFRNAQIRGQQIKDYNFLTDPRSMPSSSRPEVNPSPVADGSTPMPRGRPEAAGPRPEPAGPTGDPGQLNRMANALVTTLGGLLSGGGGASAPRDPNAPPSSFGGSAGNLLAGLLGGGGSAPKDPSKPSFSSAVAAPAPPQADPFTSGAPPIQASPQQLAQVMAGAQRAKDEQKQPAQAPQATQAPATVTPPVPPGRDLPPPPAYQPSLPTFKGYEVRPREPKKGEEKDRTKALQKDNNLYYYSRIGAQQDDNAAVAKRVRELREKASNPKTAKNITPEEDRIITQYSDFAKRGTNYAPNLASMEPEAVAERMRGYKAGGATQIPERYSERPPGVEGGGDPARLKLPPKGKDPAVVKAEDYIDNPKKRNDTDKDDDDVREE
jgi:hypothetical protein